MHPELTKGQDSLGHPKLFRPPSTTIRVGIPTVGRGKVKVKCKDSSGTLELLFPCTVLTSFDPHTREKHQSPETLMQSQLTGERQIRQTSSQDCILSSNKLDMIDQMVPIRDVVSAHALGDDTQKTPPETLVCSTKKQASQRKTQSTLLSKEFVQTCQ